jgi:succinoglycan biosynthesis transport protein ExoP
VKEGTEIQRLEPQVFRADSLSLGNGKSLIGADESVDLRTHLRSLFKRRWTILSVLFVTFTLVLIATVKEKPTYRARAMLEIGPENPSVATVNELFQIQNVSDDHLQTQYRILQSDSLARQVIKQLHLDQNKEFNPSPHPWPWRARSNRVEMAEASFSIDTAYEQSMVRNFEGRLRIDPIERSRLVRVSFDSHDAKMASSVVNNLAATYIQENLEAHWQATQQASGWLSKQLADLKGELEKSEDNLQRYALENGLVFLESSKGEKENITDARLRQLQDELTQVQADRYEKESLNRLVEAGDYGGLPGVFDDKTMRDLTAQLATLELQQADLAANFESAYPKMKQIQSQIDRVQEVLKQQQQEAASHIAEQYLAASRREALIRQAFEKQQKEANVVAGKLVQYNILKREVDSNKQLYEGLLQRLKEAGISAGLNASNIRVVDAAVPPMSPAKPRVLLNLALGLIAGAVLGVGLALLQEHLDNTLKSTDDIERFLRMPALAMIPSRQSFLHEKNGHRKSLPEILLGVAGKGRQVFSKGEPQDSWFRIDSEAMERSILSEAFRGLRTSVLLSTASRPPRSLAFVSAEPGEGKTTICSNLAISLAQLGKRVLVVDGDMRRPKIHALFDLQPRVGLVNYLAGQEEWRGLLQPSGVDGLDCLVCGPVPPNPSELLSSERMQTLLKEAVADYSFVFLDSPPLLNLADGRILSTMAEGAVLVVKGGATPRELVQRAQSYVSDVGAHLIGVVLNNMDARHDGYYSYSHYYYYSATSERGDERAEP